MLRTLYMYLSRDLIKSTALSLAAFTLVMTVLSIVEPLRKQGLGAEQAALLFVYTLPVMLSFTLPIAALFASTIVYGRLAQDNELMACRASGIASFTLLKPALVLGMVVTVVTLWMSNYVAPLLLQQCESMVKSNVKAIIFRQLRAQNYFKRDNRILHVDQIDEKTDLLRGVVVADTDPASRYGGESGSDNNNKKKDVTIVAAEGTQVRFDLINGDLYATVEMENPVVARGGRFDVAQEGYQPIDSLAFSSPLKENVGWYTWDRLLWAHNHPDDNRDLRRALEDIRGNIAVEGFARDIARTISENKPFTGLSGRDRTCVITAPSARQRGMTAELRGDANAAANCRVKAEIRDSREIKTILADMATIEATWLRKRVSITFRGDVRTRVQTVGVAAGSLGDGPDDWTRKDIANVGELELPAAVVDAAGRISADEIYSDNQKLTTNPKIREEIGEMRGELLHKIEARIQAEIHGRLAYGASCFLLVAMGAVMGLLFRGGQIISAFALAIIPATIVIVMIVMGKQMLSHPEVPRMYGLACVWGGVAALFVGNIWTHVLLLRR